MHEHITDGQSAPFQKGLTEFSRTTHKYDVAAIRGIVYSGYLDFGLDRYDAMGTKKSPLQAQMV